jgi:uncharacterized integral membrane protein
MPTKVDADARNADARGPSAVESDGEYVRRAYERAIDWYKVAETKAQLVLTVNGILVTILFGLLVGRPDDAAQVADVFGVETWAFVLVAVGALIGALLCAAATLWSRHRKNVRKTFLRLGVNPEKPSSYRPEVLWYFGYLAYLEPDAAAEHISRADRSFETTALSFNLVNLSGIVLRKHRLINAAWMLTSLCLILLMAGGTSILIRTQL